MRSADIQLFEIPFDTICEIVSDYGIDFNWGEKDREKSRQAWDDFCALSTEHRTEIGNRIVSLIQKDLHQTLSKVLDNTMPRPIEEVEIQVTTNLGEVKIFTFYSVEEALRFLQDLDQEEILRTEDAPSLFENADVQVEEPL